MRFLVALLLMSVLATAAEEDVESYLAQEPKDTTFEAVWKRGLLFRTADGDFTMRIGGRILVDLAWQTADPEFLLLTDPDAADDVAFFRQTRLTMQGRFHKNIVWKTDYEFATANSDAAFKDMWIGVENLPLFPHLRVGNQKIMQGLEHLASLLDLTFMERSAATNAFIPSRRVGFSVYNQRPWRGKPHTFIFAFGIFRPSDPDTGSFVGDNGVEASLRIADAIFLERETPNVTLIHLGVSFTYSRPSDDAVEFTARGTVGTGPAFLDTGTIASDQFWVTGFELAAMRGPFLFQSEYFLTQVDTLAGDDLVFYGYYISFSFALTGEHRPYKGEERGTFGRIVPHRTFLDEGLGALQLTFRFENTDLKDGAVDGGDWTAYTAGVNWYWNFHVRVMLNYVHGDLEQMGIEGSIDSIMLRFQVAF